MTLMDDIDLLQRLEEFGLERLLPILISICVYLSFSFFLRWKKSLIIKYLSKKLQDEGISTGDQIYNLIKHLSFLILILVISYILVPEIGIIIVASSAPTILILISPIKFILDDCIAYFIIVLSRKCCKVDDIIKIEDFVGQVEEIGFRMMKLKGNDGTFRYIYNSNIKEITNLTYSPIYLDFPISQSQDLEKVDQIITIIEKMVHYHCEMDILNQGMIKKEGLFHQDKCFYLSRDNKNNQDFVDNKNNFILRYSYIPTPSRRLRVEKYINQLLLYLVSSSYPMEEELNKLVIY